MRIAVFGLGYVGSVTAVCLALNHHEVWGVDEHALKVDWLARGIPPLKEPEFAEKLRDVLKTGRFKVTTSAAEAIRDTDAALICVGTPTAESGAVNLAAVEKVIRQIGACLAAEHRPYLVAVRSTIPPGTMETLVVPALTQAAGRPLGRGFQACFNPEFLREGTAIKDFFAPPFTVVGIEGDREIVADVIGKLERVYALENVQTVALNFKEAELVKVISNAYHALKINFANEVGSIAASVGADAERLMEAFSLDTKLNISAKYLRPGFAFGGSCLPKDVRGLIYLAQSHGLKIPLLDAILPSNQEHLNRSISLVQSLPGKVIGIAGLVFKPDTDDVRESPAVALARALIDSGRTVLIYEPEIEVARLVGANLAYLETALPEFREYLVPQARLLSEAENIVVTRPRLLAANATGRSKLPVLELYRLENLPRV